MGDFETNPTIENWFGSFLMNFPAALKAMGNSGDTADRQRLESDQNTVTDTTSVSAAEFDDVSFNSFRESLSRTQSCYDFRNFEFSKLCQLNENDVVSYGQFLPMSKDADFNYSSCSNKISLYNAIEAIETWRDLPEDILNTPPKSPSAKVGTKTSIRSHITTRCFNNAKDKNVVHDYSCVSLTIPEIRIVLDTKEYPHAEFLLVGFLGGSIVTSWVRYSEFAKMMRGLEKTSFERTHKEWEFIQSTKHPFRCLDHKYLRVKARKINKLVRFLLFEVASLNELIKHLPK
mmetsp:Transcript_19583/g.29027  ORF Transcript_19583/g.29027 Transcript_19583/m.29027 type:complete len:289 (+) Transcript_19583:121-987(+)